MKHRAHIQTILAHTTLRTGSDGLFLFPDHWVRILRLSLIAPKPFLRPSAQRQTNDGGDSLAVWFTHSPLLQPDSVATNPRVCVGAVASAFSTGTLQADVSIERQFSSIFPAHPRSLASVLIPRPAALRGSASATPPCGFRLSENLFGKLRTGRGRKDFPNLPKKRRLALGTGHTRVASRKSVPRVRRTQRRTPFITQASI